MTAARSAGHAPSKAAAATTITATPIAATPTTAVDDDGDDHAAGLSRPPERPSRVAGVDVVRTVAGLRALRRGLAGSVALVPTMGALHEGHLTLVDHAATLADYVVVSIFVNPTQFAPGEDFDSYPRTFEADCALCASRGVAVVFAPLASEMYPDGDQTEVQAPALGSGLCGVTRPHFFAGVARVVLKLLNIAQADAAVFGEKDYQQLQVIRRMARDLHHPTRIVGAPTHREPDGLAMSSRNRYLSAPQRHAAAAIYRALRGVQTAVSQGERDAARLIDAAKAEIVAAGGEPDYVAIVDAQNLNELARIDRPARAAVAAWFGEARLIDNVALIP